MEPNYYEDPPTAILPGPPILRSNGKWTEHKQNGDTALPFVKTELKQNGVTARRSQNELIRALFPRELRTLILLLGAAAVVVQFPFLSNKKPARVTINDSAIRKVTELVADDTSPYPPVLTQPPKYPFEQKSNVPWNGIENAEWCQAPTAPPLPFDECKWRSFAFRFPADGGLTNALHFIMKGALWAFQESVCFYVDELTTVPKMAEREPKENTVYPFLTRYFEPMGLPNDHPILKEATTIVSPNYHQINYHEFGKYSGGLAAVDNPVRFRSRSIDSLTVGGPNPLDNITTKKLFLRRLFRILPQFRENACGRLAGLGLHDEYLALSVRRGDKVLEFSIEASLQPYIDLAEDAIQTHFGGVVPKVFVASDDCRVMDELRELRPGWVFVSECDNASEQHGFVIAEMKYWTLEQTDAHFKKFVTEMIALASAKYWIGVSTTNVSYWIYFMRHLEARDDTFKFVDVDQAVY